MKEEALSPWPGRGEVQSSGRGRESSPYPGVRNGALGSEWEKEVFGIKEDSEGWGTPTQKDGSSFWGEEDAKRMQGVPGVHEMHLGYSMIFLIIFFFLPALSPAVMQV